MPKISLESQDKVAKTLLLPLYARAVEASHPNPMVRDARAVRMVEQIDFDFAKYRLQGEDQVHTLMRVRQFDRFVLAFLSRYPDAVVVNIGCGLDTRFERVDNQRLTWYELDLPEVIAFREKLIPPLPRETCIACSIFDNEWLSIIPNSPEGNILFIAEGVLPYFTDQQVKQILIQLADRYPGSELVCDGMTPGMVRMNNLSLKVMKIDARLHWGLKNGHQPETWKDGIRLMDEWFYFDQPEPRLGPSRWLRLIPSIARGVGIFHYQLGQVANSEK